MERIRIGLIGTGTVGSGVIEILKKESASYREKFGIELILSSVCTRTPEKIKKELQNFPNCKLESDYQKIVTDPEIDIILELVGGTDVAYSIVKEALKNGKTVITANKALLSQKGNELFSLAQEQGLEIGMEASVAGAIPVIRSIKSALGSDSFLSLYGILNGTTNFIFPRWNRNIWIIPKLLEPLKNWVSRKKIPRSTWKESIPLIRLVFWEVWHSPKKFLYRAYKSKV